MANILDRQRDFLNSLGNFLNAQGVFPHLICWCILAFFFYVALPCHARTRTRTRTQTQTSSIVLTSSSSTPNGGTPGRHNTFPLLDRLLDEVPEVVRYFVLPKLNRIALTKLAQVEKRWHAAVLSSGLQRSATPPGMPLELFRFSLSVKKYTRFKLDGTLDVNGVSGMMIRRSHMSDALSVCGHMDIHRWAEEQMEWRSTWGTHICAHAAARGHLDILKCARALDYPWGPDTCAFAARGGHLDVLRWAWSHNCPWDHRTSRCAAQSGSLEVLRWAMAHGVPVDPMRWRYYQRLVRGEPHAINHWRTIPESRLQDWQIYCD
jgi:hypothetical protein